MAPKFFTLTEDHLTLLAHANVEWWGAEYGAPAIDPKRPFGNSDVEGDVVRLLGWPTVETDDGTAFPPGTRERVRALEKELVFALPIVLQHGRKPGVYRRDDGWLVWHLEEALDGAQ